MQGQVGRLFWVLTESHEPQVPYTNPKPTLYQFEILNLPYTNHKPTLIGPVVSKYFLSSLGLQIPTSSYLLPTLNLPCTNPLNPFKRDTSTFLGGPYTKSQEPPSKELTGLTVPLMTGMALPEELRRVRRHPYGPGELRLPSLDLLELPKAFNSGMDLM